MKRTSFLAFVNLFLVFYCSSYFLFPDRSLELLTEPTLTALDVGQGDALLIAIPQTSIQILVDTGPINQNLVAKIKDRLPKGDKNIDLVFISHCHDDHLGGIGAVIDSFKIGLLVETGAICKSKHYQDLMTKVKARQIPVLYGMRGQIINIGHDFKTTIVHPFFSVGAEYKNINESSLALLFEYQDRAVFLSGDLEKGGEATLIHYLDQNPSLKTKLRSVTTLKANHHGSSGSNTLEFLSLFPAQANILISSGRDNPFGHPGTEAIQRMTQKDFQIKQTEKEKDITVVF